MRNKSARVILTQRGGSVGGAGAGAEGQFKTISTAEIGQNLRGIVNEIVAAPNISTKTVKDHSSWIMAALAFLFIVAIVLFLLFLHRKVKRIERGALQTGAYEDDEDLDYVDKTNPAQSPGTKWSKSVRSYAITVDKAATARINTVSPQPMFQEEMSVSCQDGSTVPSVLCKYEKSWWLVFRSDGGVADIFASDVLSGRTNFALMSGVVMRLKHGQAALSGLSRDVLIAVYSELSMLYNPTYRRTKNVADVKDELSKMTDTELDPNNFLKNFDVASIVAVAPAQNADIVTKTQALQGCKPIISLPWPSSSYDNFTSALSQPGARLRFQILAW